MHKETIGRATLYLGDAREVLPRLRRQIDAVVTDPPYHLQAAYKNQLLGFRRIQATGGFMGQLWDGGDVAFRSETWSAIGDALRLGGFLMAFGGTRTYHRMTCAIEDSGFVVQDCLMWLYGSGFPKNRAMLKPAYEPIVLAYKPGGKRTMQVDECRIGTDENLNGGAYAQTTDHRTVGMLHSGVGGGVLHNGIGEYQQPAGRWPANVCHDGSEEVTEAFAAFGERSSGKLLPTHNAKPSPNGSMSGGNYAGRIHSEFGGDSGSAARFFYCAKANKRDRAGSRHPTVKPQALMRWLIPLVTPRGGTVLDPFGGSGSTAEAALATGRRCVLIEREPQWFDDACRRLEAAQLQHKRAA